MDLPAVTAVRDRPGPVDWRPGDAWLAGGTWLFSEPQPGTQRLLDLTTLGWAPLTLRADGLEIAATCTITELETAELPPQWTAAPLVRQCCRAFLASFKVRNVATVGGNLCLALPAGPMISLAAALDATCTIWRPDASVREITVPELVTGAGTTSLEPGELLRSVWIPAASLRSRAAMRNISLRDHGRSAALVIGRAEPHRLVITVTASTTRPVVVELAPRPDAAQLRAALVETLPPEAYHDDAHGDPDWREHLTWYLAEQIRVELTRRDER